MNTPLRDEILQIIRQPRLNHVEVILDDLDIAHEILALIASKMPEKKTHNLGNYTLEELGKLEQDAFEKIMYDEGFQDAITEVKSILKGGTV